MASPVTPPSAVDRQNPYASRRSAESRATAGRIRLSAIDIWCRAEIPTHPRDGDAAPMSGEYDVARRRFIEATGIALFAASIAGCAGTNLGFSSGQHPTDKPNTAPKVNLTAALEILDGGEVSPAGILEPDDLEATAAKASVSIQASEAIDSAGIYRDDEQLATLDVSGSNYTTDVEIPLNWLQDPETSLELQAKTVSGVEKTSFANITVNPPGSYRNDVILEGDGPTPIADNYSTPFNYDDSKLPDNDKIHEDNYSPDLKQSVILDKIENSPEVKQGLKEQETVVDAVNFLNQKGLYTWLENSEPSYDSGDADAFAAVMQHLFHSDELTPNIDAYVWVGTVSTGAPYGDRKDMYHGIANYVENPAPRDATQQEIENQVLGFIDTVDDWPQRAAEFKNSYFVAMDNNATDIRYGKEINDKIDRMFAHGLEYGETDTHPYMTKRDWHNSALGTIGAIADNPLGRVNGVDYGRIAGGGGEQSRVEINPELLGSLVDTLKNINDPEKGVPFEWFKDAMEHLLYQGAEAAKNDQYVVLAGDSLEDIGSYTLQDKMYQGEDIMWEIEHGKNFDIPAMVEEMNS